jgi:hypothetical protein
LPDAPERKSPKTLIETELAASFSFFDCLEAATFIYFQDFSRNLKKARRRDELSCLKGSVPAFAARLDC